MIDVLICDDSASMRAVMREIISAQSDLQCVGEAEDPYEARELIKALHPNVLTLDVEMPRMSGIEFLEKLMRLRPMPVVMCSTLTQRGSDTAIAALQLGAIDAIPKPEADAADAERFAEELVEKIRIAARSHIRRPLAQSPVEQAHRAEALVRRSDRVVAVGASTGGCQAVGEIVSQLPAEIPAVVIAQHMPALFTRSYAQRLDRSARPRVKEAEDGEPLLTGHVYIGPGNRHIRVERSGDAFKVALDDGPRRYNVRPAVDTLFESVAKSVKSRAVGVILTGMGYDGAGGLLAMRQAGAYTIAQDEATCVVFGMPKAAIEKGAAQAVLPLERIVPAVLERLRLSPAATVRAQ